MINIPTVIMYTIKTKFKLKGDKAEAPKPCLGALLSKMYNPYGNECWFLDSNRYFKAFIKIDKSMLEKRGLQLLSNKRWWQQVQ